MDLRSGTSQLKGDRRISAACAAAKKNSNQTRKIQNGTPDYSIGIMALN
jgi:hypothetical protein